jgi:hypothetical protein
MRDKFFISPFANTWMLGLRWDPKKRELLIGGPRTFEEQIETIAELLELPDEYLKEVKFYGPVKVRYIYILPADYEFNLYAGIRRVERNMDAVTRRVRSFARLLR